MRWYPMIAALLLAGCSAELILPPLNPIPSTFGFLTRSSFRFQAAFSSTQVPCRTASGIKIASQGDDGWYHVSGLSAGVSDAVVCYDEYSQTTISARTLASPLEAPNGTEGFTQNGVTYTFGQCFNHQRSLAYNPVTGSLDIFGQTGGSASSITNACFGTYDGTQWHFLRFDNLEEANATVVDFNAGYGLVYLPDGTTVVRDTARQSGVSYDRVHFCSSDCGNKANWAEVVMTTPDISAATMNPCQAAISVNRAGTKLALVNGCGTAHYTECSLSTDCRQLANWSTPLRLGGAFGNGVSSSPFWDRDDGIWFTAASGTNSYLHCPGGSDCRQLASWKLGLITGGYSPYGVTYFEQDGSVIRILSYRDGSLGASFITAASCDMDGATPCATVSGGAYTGFSVVTLSVPNARLGVFRKTTSGYHMVALDMSDSYRTKGAGCSGTFPQCFTDLSLWSSFALAPDGRDHIWALYMERSAFVDAEGAPAFWTNETGAAGLTYLSP